MAEDAEMAGAEGEGAVAVGEVSDDGSEDLEADSSGSEDEELEEEEVEGEGEGDDAMEVDGVEKPNGTNGVEHHMDEVMAH
jgi:histone chaperone ASF1